MLESICRAKAVHGFQLHAWVIMPEHVHLLLRPGRDRGESSIERCLRLMKLSVSCLVLPRWKKQNAPILDRIRLADGSLRFWQKGGGFDRNVRDEGELSRTIKYIHLNPVERGLVEKPEDWKWSSVRWWSGLRDGEVPCDWPPGPGWPRWKGFR
jgi:putative transposase